MTQALANLKLLAMGEKDISLGKTKSQEAVFADLEESLRSKK